MVSLCCCCCCCCCLVLITLSFLAIDGVVVAGAFSDGIACAARVLIADAFSGVFRLIRWCEFGPHAATYHPW